MGTTEGTSDAIELGMELGSSLGSALIILLGALLGVVDEVADGFDDGINDGILLILGMDDGDVTSHSPQYIGQLNIGPIKSVLHLWVGFSFTQLQFFISDPDVKVVDSTVNISGLFVHWQ